MQQHGEKKLLNFCFQEDLFTAIHKHYSVEEWKQFAIRSPDVIKVRNATTKKKKKNELGRSVMSFASPPPPERCCELRFEPRRLRENEGHTRSRSAGRLHLPGRG